VLHYWQKNIFFAFFYTENFGIEVWGKVRQINNQQGKI
jgi:hypothetical protein